ncbi:MAG: hypothetical protein ACLP9Y_21895 [Mycobacterium sp.]
MAGRQTEVEPGANLLGGVGVGVRPAATTSPTTATPVTDAAHVHRRLLLLLIVLEQHGIVVGDDLHAIRTTP